MPGLTFPCTNVPTKQVLQAETILQGHRRCMPGFAPPNTIAIGSVTCWFRSLLDIKVKMLIGLIRFKSTQAKPSNPTDSELNRFVTNAFVLS